jgi:hypothetical protein
MPSRVIVNQSPLHRHRNEGDAVTEDRTWVRHSAPQIKRQSMEWKHSTSPVRKKFRTQPSAEKVMLTLFGSHNGQFWNITKRGAQQ